MSTETHAHGAVHPLTPPVGGPDDKIHRGVFLKIGAKDPITEIYQLSNIKNVAVKAANGGGGLVRITVTFDADKAKYQDQVVSWNDVKATCHPGGTDPGYAFMGFSDSGSSTTIGLNATPDLVVAPDPNGGTYTSVSMALTMSSGKVDGAAGDLP
jgi:hypothetical protein